ncbi:TetR/AcrR family transcriptional regulator C-terminal ligand-binding domain-containing protein [Streptomyces cyaneofuscatus]|uniref:TetR/AcrR family transcriptional regulator C-terminal ligand-binding domain-containing protein n=1 Tax=Streptomyces cyaneofuscatus TaxID=66883 RepID=UPI0036679414
MTVCSPTSPSRSLRNTGPYPTPAPLRGDLLAWATAGEKSLSSKKGRVVLRAIAFSMAGGPERLAEQAEHFAGRTQAIEEIRGRAIRRGETPLRSATFSTRLSRRSTSAPSSSPPDTEDYSEVLVRRLLASPDLTDARADEA